ncbi:ankyrin repeat domain-containing protein [Wolbachia endosymbiont of Drosophila pseudotakahashii]|uniref:ankyrin repeat domain-containing protein n=1 Tax=Wolbachia endosymbiont of Drosophila pseudotakahashii TaxID=375919 RepID=UPI00222ED82B|nr:ankyrin repeat domain-containing protein [Wolbachia endosymbiont of Drosophila pseudotakahashii]MCX3064712.1 ankyrin repeat domain-containing protein [Wolbachia endosymbiont of Drosophila pseudotakahashii]UZE38432.1 ankyrin repeat domain-containing protein [Wolbachia endosymbiont of Drosophila pseudotakahashii]
MAIKKEKFFEIINEVSKSEGLNENNLLERIGNKLKGVNSGVYDTYNKLKIGNTSKTFSTFNKLKINEINKMFRVSDSYKIVNYTLLHLAVECNSVPIVKLLLAKGVKVNKPTHELDGVKSQLTALHIAALHGHQEIVQLLLNNDANPLLKDSQGRTPRDIVGDVKGKKAIIEMLEEGEQRYAEAGATRRQNRQGTLPQPNNKTPGNLAVNGNNATAAVQACNARDQEENNGTTPNNRKIYVQDEDEQTSSNSIVNENNTDKVDDTLEREQAIRERDAMLQKLREAEQRLANNQKRIEQDYLHDQHLEQYTIHNGEQTFLNKSSSDDSGICFDGDGSEALGQSILENGEDIDSQDKDGVTPLHWAVADNNKELAKLLIKHGADVDARNRDKHTPLHYAAVHGYVEIAKYLIDNGANVNAQDQDEHIPLYFAVTNGNKELAKLLIKYGADRSLIKDEDLIDRLNSMCDQPSEVVPSTFSHSKTHNATETPEKAEKVEKRKAKLKELRTQLKDEQKKNELLKQKIQDLESKNTTLNSELEENENKHYKTKVLLEKAQKELAESKSCIVGHETKLKQFNKENESLTQKIKSLENENTPLEGELGKTKTKTKTNEVSLEKAGKRQMSFLKVASVNLVTMLTVGATLSIAFDLSVLPIIVVFVTSAALLASCVTYAISKPIAEPKPTTELKEVDIQGSAQRCL